jgi:hypothetical protein
MRIRFLFFAFLLPLLHLLNPAVAQQPINIRLNSIELKEMPGLQSFAAAQYQSKWVLIGGRLDGLHMKQPFASFNPEFNNTDIVVVDFLNKKVIKSSVLSLPKPISEQLQSSNMEFVQLGNLLYLFGGYGYSASQRKFLTHPRLTVIHLPQLIEAVLKNNSLEPCIFSIEDDRMAVTGGGAGVLNNRFFIIGGQKFTGRYNPHGPDHGPGFVQEYTNEIRSFELELKETSIRVLNYKAVKDETELHRRDYNLVPQIFPSGKQGFTVFSGVFQYKENLPWLHPVDVFETGYQPNNQFQQRFNHYHSAHLAVYSKKQNQMSTIFFGGIAQFYREKGITKEDTEVPFVNTISQVSRSANGAMQELVLDATMPGLLGSSAWFFFNEQLPHFDNEILNWDALAQGEQLAGYIIGGIHSSAPNIFWPNTGDQSIASASIIAVYIRK